MAEVPIPGVLPADIATGRRPRNRRETILKVSASLFAERGFSGTRMDDIAAGSGVTVRALYRHFDNKLAILVELVESSQDRFLEAVAAATQDPSDPPRRFIQAVRGLAVASEESSHFAVLWQRESRHLEPEAYSRLRLRLNSMVRSISDLIEQAEPGLSAFQRELRAWATISVMVAPRSDNEGDTAIAAAEALIRTGTPARLEVRAIDTKAVATDEDTSRRERLLASAALAFSRTGFLAAGIDEIGRTAGVSGPSLYRHFGSKNELLDALARRRESWLWYEADTRRATDQDPTTRLRATTEAFVVASLRAPELVAIWVTENPHVSPPVRQKVATSIAAFHSTWSTALQRVRPDLAPATCNRLIALAVETVEDLVRTRHLHREPTLAGDLTGMVESLLLQPGIVT